ncbi:single-stranded DNA-binding protein [Candidatus Saccharibacteria bacterium]|nr:single-stranded DNA-binding protein [Candidatus Saccharibacteria bacterium]
MNAEQSLEFAKKYCEDLLSFFGLNLEVTVELRDEVIELMVPSNDSNSVLIGHNAETLRSIQYLISTTLRNRDAAIVRVNVDIAEYKKQRADKLAHTAKGWIEEVRSTGESRECALNPADRRIVHHVAGEFSDITTYSVGEGRERRLIIAKK